MSSNEKDSEIFEESLTQNDPKRAVAGLQMAHLPRITSSFELSVLTLTVPGLRLRQIKNTL
jgi:hypothetical protein